jgi:hypothetical protein
MSETTNYTTTSSIIIPDFYPEPDLSRLSPEQLQCMEVMQNTYAVQVARVEMLNTFGLLFMLALGVFISSFFVYVSKTVARK